MRYLIDGSAIQGYDREQRLSSNVIAFFIRGVYAGKAKVTLLKTGNIYRSVVQFFQDICS